MKIGIITVPLVANYGGLMQAYALQTILQKLGHEVTIIDRLPNRWKIKPFKYPLSITKRLIRKYLLDKNKTIIFLEHREKKLWPIISERTNKFIKNHLNNFVVNDFSKLKNGDYDALIAGSDQVWRPKFYPFIQDAFFDFAKNWKNIKRLSYAASFGTDEWEYTLEETKQCCLLAKKFDFISVREEGGISLCKEKLGVDAIHVLDPTMLLDKDDYINLFKDSQLENKGDLLAYVLDTSSDIENNIKSFSIHESLTPFYFNSKVDVSTAKLEERIQKPVELWLKGFDQAKFIITDSFHACVFSLIFNKPFAVIGNKQRGMDRFKSLLATYGLEKRLIENFDDIYKLGNIDWEFVNQRRSELASYSLKNLIDHLKR